MKRFDVAIQPTAEQAIAESLDWISRHVSRAAAERWLAGLKESLESLSTFPERCELAPEAEDFEEPVRQLLYGRRPHVYRVLFVVLGNAVSVRFVRHAAQRWLHEVGGDEESA